ncbi:MULTISPECIES: YihY/virulence factor BrkB family protein [unclassified Acidovorax]|uniref:YihY/virulence factor BrkB family protein n=1 Tax=unclassified Acidovorax TaxID=2684926 RepID=UPI00145F8FD7|nr:MULTISPECIES: YihY/virulence factor BrkB family protein [unclassified Acidovorax]
MPVLPDDPARFVSSAPPRPWWPVRAVELWLGADGLRMSAAMSFYGMLSLAPLLVVVVAALGWWVDRSLVENNLLAQIRALSGDRTAEVVQQALASAKAPSQGLAASAVALLLLLWGATGVFAELQAAFARLWQEENPAPSSRPAWWITATMRVRGLAYVLAMGFLLLVSLLVSAALAVASAWLGKHLPFHVLLVALSEGVSFVFAAALFFGLMRISVDPKPRLRYLALGAVIGAGLFTVGRHALSAYLASAAVVSAYGAAGSLVALLVWIYFSSAVLLLSAGCARALQERSEAVATAA